MQLIKWEPFNEIDRIFEEFPSASFPRLGRDLAVDIYEKDGNVVAKINVPGINPEKIELSVEDDTLRVSGSHEEEKEEKGKEYYRKEIKSGSFYRSVLLPKSVDSKDVHAEYKDGVLMVTMPTSKEQRNSRVKIDIKK